MTTTPAMPELPEPELGYIETDKSRQPAFSARQMRAAMQAQPADVSDAEIDAVTLEQWGQDAIRAAHRQYARAILALRPQAVPMTEAMPQDMGQATIMGDCIYAGIFEDEVSEVKSAVVIKFESDDKLRDFLRWHHGITAPAGGEG